MDNRQERVRQYRAYGVLLAVAAIWGGGFVAGKITLTGTTPLPILVWRFSASALLCGVLFWKKLSQTPKKTAVCGALIGVLHALALGVQLSGLRYTTPAKQSFLCATYVVITPWLSWLISRNRPGLRAVAGGIAAIAGVGLICLEGSFGVNRGDLLSLGFAALFTLQLVLVGKYVGKDMDSTQLTFFQFLSAALLSLTACLVRGESLRITGGEALAGMVYLAVINTCLCFLMQHWAQRYADDSVAALILSLESVFGFLFSVLYYREPVTARLVLGGTLCFAAVLLNTAPVRQRAPQTPANP